MILAAAVILGLTAAAAVHSQTFAASQAAADRAFLRDRVAGLIMVDALPVLESVDGERPRVELFRGPASEQWVMVTNTSDQQANDYRLQLRQKATIYETSRITGLPRRRGRQETYLFELAPGSAALFRLQPGPEAPHLKPRVMINPSVQYGNVILDDAGNPVYNEGETMWDIAERVKSVLDADGRVEAHLSRKGRTAASTIQEECELAQLIGCDAFVALHSDATADGSEGGGTWAFYADDDGKRLGDHVQSRVLAAIREVYPQVVDRGVKEHWSRLYVLHNSGCPASLTEILFHSNPAERELLKQPEFQERVAKSVAQGILDYFGFGG